MNHCFELLLQDSTHQLQEGRAISFVGRDASGRFGIQAGHEPFLTCLEPGLARFRNDGGVWQYIAQPGAVLRFHQQRLQLITTQFVVSEDRAALLSLLESDWQQAAHTRQLARRNQVQIEQALARKLWQMSRGGEAL